MMASILLQRNEFRSQQETTFNERAIETIGWYHRQRYVAPNILANPRREPQKNPLRVHGQKYCIYQRPHLWSKEMWKCYRCTKGTETNVTCDERLRRRKQCPPFLGLLNDTASWYDGKIGSVPTRSLKYLKRHLYQQQPACTMATCFDFTRCQNLISNSTLDIFVNGTTTESERLLNEAQQKLSGIWITLVSDPSEACIVFIHKSTYASADELYNTKHWRDSAPFSGQNHLLWQSNQYQYGGPKSRQQRLTGDAPFSAFSTGYALLASSSLNRQTVRLGYDLVLPLIRYLPRQWRRLIPPDQVDIHRPRKWLITFRGSIQNSIHVGYQQRWLAAEYWTSSNVMVDVQFRSLQKGSRRTIKSYDFPPTIYDDLIMNSTFGFCPSGSGISSYRVAEVMSTGGIPVVVGPSVVPPLEMDEDFHECWITVAMGDIPDLPRRLGLISKSEIRARQHKCWQLYQSIWGDTLVRYGPRGPRTGWTDDEKVLLASALSALVRRIRTFA